MGQQKSRLWLAPCHHEARTNISYLQTKDNKPIFRFEVPYTHFAPGVEDQSDPFAREVSCAIMLETGGKDREQGGWVNFPCHEWQKYICKKTLATQGISSLQGVFVG